MGTIKHRTLFRAGSFITFDIITIYKIDGVSSADIQQVAGQPCFNRVWNNDLLYMNVILEIFRFV